MTVGLSVPVTTVEVMARRHDRKRGGRTTPKGTRPQRGPRPVREDIPPLVAEVREYLREPSPFALLALASGLVEATTPRRTDAWPGNPIERPDGPSTFESFLASGWPELSALTVGIAELHPDELLAARLRAGADLSLLERVPAWLGSLGDVVVSSVGEQTDILGDGDNILVSWSWPVGSAATAIVYIDHNMGTLVKDAFVVPEDGDEIAALYTAVDAGARTQPLDPAAAAARIRGALDATDMVVPPIETESWPACRPMIEWVLRRLPTGGAGYVRPEWGEAARDELVADFVGSEHGRIGGLSATDVRDLVDPLIWFACDYGPGDPLRWSPVSVEIVLADWYPRKVFGLPATQLRRLADVLAGFVRFSHARRGVPGDLTAQTMAAIADWTPDFHAAIAAPGRSPATNAARLARIAAGLEPDEAVASRPPHDEPVDVSAGTGWPAAGVDPDDPFDLVSVAAELEDMLVDLVGGRDAYDALDDEPLADVAFDWQGVPAASRDLTAETLALLDQWSGELYDTEVRTIARRVLHVVVVTDPSVFKRSARADALAAGILGYLMNRLTGRLSAEERRAMGWQVHTKKDLALATGVSASTVSSRSRTISNVMERAALDWSSWLHSSQRREVLDTRATIDAWRDRDSDAGQ